MKVNLKKMPRQFRGICQLKDLNMKASGHIFNNTGDSLSATHAGCNNAIFFIQSFHIIQYLDGKFTSGTSQADDPMRLRPH